ncbi:MAG: hypothetical protein LBP62_03555 [Clostridiales bacterium]|nr:hypothetical protein [Clostridiales bacterium]
MKSTSVGFLTEQNLGLLKLIGAEVDERLNDFLCAPTINEQAEEPVCEMPIGITPYRHQIKGFKAVYSSPNTSGLNYTIPELPISRRQKYIAI